MIKARMFVVNSETLDESLKTGVASFRIPRFYDEDKKQYTSNPTKNFISSIDSMIADILQLNIGDYFYFWCEKKQMKSMIYGVYRIISKPFFSQNGKDDAPFKIFFEEAYKFKNPITEYDVLNSPFIKIDLWNIRGKKTSGKGRGSTPITYEECKVLLDLLIDKNPNYSFIPYSEARVKKELNYKGETYQPIIIDYKKRGKKLQRPKSIYDFSIYEFNHFSKTGILHYEKSLECIFNYEINNKNKGFLAEVGIDAERIVWNANYLPYSLDNTEMDYLVIESFDGISFSKLYVIEFTNDPLDEDHFYRSLLYSKWVNDNLCSGAVNCVPLIICSESPDFKKSNKEEINRYVLIEKEFKDKYGLKTVHIYKYDFSNEKPKFIRKK